MGLKRYIGLMGTLTLLHSSWKWWHPV